MSDVCIYVIFDRRDPLNLRYVGQTKEEDLRVRLAGHVARPTGALREWISTVPWESLGICFVQRCPPEAAQRAEAALVARLEREGHDILNLRHATTCTKHGVRRERVGKHLRCPACRKEREERSRASEGRKAYVKEWKRKNAAKVQEYSRAGRAKLYSLPLLHEMHKASEAAKRRERYQSDPDYRAKRLARARGTP